MQLAEVDRKRKAEVLRGPIFLADLLARYSIIEADYRDPAISAVPHAEERIVSVYIAILRYCVEVQKVKDRNPPGKFRQCLEKQLRPQ